MCTRVGRRVCVDRWSRVSLVCSLHTVVMGLGDVDGKDGGMDGGRDVCGNELVQNFWPGVE